MGRGDESRCSQSLASSVATHGRLIAIRRLYKCVRKRTCVVTASPSRDAIDHAAACAERDQLGLPYVNRGGSATGPSHHARRSSSGPVGIGPEFLNPEINRTRSRIVPSAAVVSFQSSSRSNANGTDSKRLGIFRRSTAARHMLRLGSTAFFCNQSDQLRIAPLSQDSRPKSRSARDDRVCRPQRHWSSQRRSDLEQTNARRRQRGRLSHLFALLSPATIRNSSPTSWEISAGMPARTPFRTATDAVRSEGYAQWPTA